MQADTFILQREARGGPGVADDDRLRRPGRRGRRLARAAGVGAGPRRAPAPAPPARYRGIDMATARRARLSTDARREQLVALGVEMFSERPFDEVSIDDIAASAGISKGLLYHYFPSKRDFYVAVVRHSADEMQAVTETDPDLAPLERLSTGLDKLPGVRRHPRPRLLDRAARRHRLRPRGRGHRRGRPLRDGRPASSTTSPAGEPVAAACASRCAAGSASPRPRASSGSSAASSRATSCATCSSRRSPGAIGAGGVALRGAREARRVVAGGAAALDWGPWLLPPCRCPAAERADAGGIRRAPTSRLAHRACPRRS